MTNNDTNLSITFLIQYKSLTLIKLPGQYERGNTHHTKYPTNDNRKTINLHHFMIAISTVTKVLRRIQTYNMNYDIKQTNNMKNKIIIIENLIYRNDAVQ